MKEKRTIIQWSNEVIWIVASIVIAIYFTWNIQSRISTTYLIYLYLVIILAINYLRWIIFPRNSPLMYSFWFKAVLTLLNIPLFIVIIKYFLSVLEVFDSFNFSYGNHAQNLILQDTPFQMIMYIRTLSIAAVSSLLVLIVIFEFRALQLIFKWRQVPQSILK
ncbi:MAG: hypothetical protein M9958_06115 [Chitinophagales bacterium]|nr:hypothetical protein [Chitinophagales bacterium]